MTGEQDNPSPIAYRFLAEPTIAETDRIQDLYRAEGWWEAQDDRAPDLVHRIVRGSHCFLVAEAGERIVGMGRAISDGVSDGYVQDVTVDADYRRKGVGSGIVRRICDRLREDGLSWIGLVAERGSHPFYERLGFRVMPSSLPMRKKEEPCSSFP